MIQAVLALALTMGNPTSPTAVVAVDTIRVVAHHAIDDVLETVAVRAGLVRQVDNLRLT
jgi:hypothetical protein